MAEMHINRIDLETVTKSFYQEVNRLAKELTTEEKEGVKKVCAVFDAVIKGHKKELP